MSDNAALVDRLTRAGTSGVAYQALLAMLVTAGAATDADEAANQVEAAVAEGSAVRVSGMRGRVYLAGSVPGYAPDLTLHGEAGR
jgi:hypothetical protein